ncbi:MAG TPA: dihydropteroate synthase [Methylococcus sp.]|nr:dihydropteroate synthase [Methylococcus sp.]
MLALLDSERPLIMGILNVTPDSFSDGGFYVDAERAVQAGVRMVEEGADLIDVGGESTRPGSEPVPAREQIARVVPVIRRLRDALPERIAISVDTTRVEVAHAALSVGADWINDVSAGRDDPEMFPLAASRGVPIVLMHMQGTPKTMQNHPSYRDVVEEVIAFLLERARAAEQAGVPRTSIVLDPGIGFGKRRDDNLRLLAHLGKLVDTGYPILLGTSRKRFMGSICGETDPRALVSATVATTALGVVSGVRIFRVHDVWQNRQAADVAAAIQRFAPSS